jgi:hypothetical protein
MARARTPKREANVSTIETIASYLNYIVTMGRKRTFDDADLVQPPSCVAIMEEKDIYKAPAEEYRQEPVWIFSKQPNYTACVAACRGSIIEKKACRKPLMELSVHTTQKSRDSKQ